MNYGMRMKVKAIREMHLKMEENKLKKRVNCARCGMSRIDDGKTHCSICSKGMRGTL